MDNYSKYYYKSLRSISRFIKMESKTNLGLALFWAILYPSG